MIRKVLLVGGIGAALCLAYPIAGTLTAQTIGDAGEACADEELGGVHSEPFTDASREGEGSFVSGWGSGGITLTRRGSAFDISTQTVGLRLTGIASGDFNGDGWVDVVGATDRPDCHLHFMENKGNDPMTGEHLGFTNGEDEGRFDDHRLGACYNFTCAHVASGDFDGDGDPDMFYAHMNCRGGGRALRTFIYENTGVVDGVPQWSVHERDQDIFHDGRITTYKNYMPFKGYDWDDDGRDDIVAVAGWDNTSELQLYRARDDELGFQSKIILIPDLEARAPMANDTQRPNTNCTGGSHGPSA
ncbi:MAG: FG-GAP-like repeat-containing protein, partial [Myxococcota bacterium]